LSWIVELDRVDDLALWIQQFDKIDKQTLQLLQSPIVDAGSCSCDYFQVVSGAREPLVERLVLAPPLPKLGIADAGTLILVIGGDDDFSEGVLVTLPYQEGACARVIAAERFGDFRFDGGEMLAGVVVSKLEELDLVAHDQLPGEELGEEVECVYDQIILLRLLLVDVGANGTIHDVEQSFLEVLRCQEEGITILFVYGLGFLDSLSSVGRPLGICGEECLGNGAD
jgi:hypothetical protein